MCFMEMWSLGFVFYFLKNSANLWRKICQYRIKHFADLENAIAFYINELIRLG